MMPLSRADDADGGTELVGDRTECGLLQMTAALGADYVQMRREGRVLRAFPFSSERKRMSSIVSQPGARSALCPMRHLRACLQTENRGYI